ncbi:MAG: hypothetical protein RL660_3175 [Bacteroidota bacterium]|jgi:hypothetical protein
MAKFLFSILITLASFTAANCQVLSDSFFVGTWKVKQIKALEKAKTENEKSAKDELTKAFTNAKFVFTAAGRFSFRTSVKEIAITNEYWKYDKSRKLVRVAPNKTELKSTKGGTMEILVELREDRVYFVLDDVPFLLEVERIATVAK